MLYGHLVPTWTFELPKLTTVFYLDIYSAIRTFELPIRMIGSNQRILELENLYNIFFFTTDRQLGSYYDK